MTLKLSFSENPDPDDVQVLTNGIKSYAKQKKGFESLDFFACFIRDADNTIVGGCSGGTLYGGLHIDNLWVSERIRHKGWGTKLMHSALNYGKEKACAFATVNTMDWEAIEFYKKLGFKLEFERHGFQKNSVFYFLRKEFQESANSTPVDNLVSRFTKNLKSPDPEFVDRKETLSKNNAPHFKWGHGCDGWWLKKDGQFTVIYETMPASSCEMKHYHRETEQFFYCLQGQLVIEFEDYELILQEHEGLSIKPRISHKAKNMAESPVCFLVVSSPNSPQDRVIWSHDV
ncbi:TPA: GNAT family N-acetyltransferase [Legionella pneumophila]|uniref:GNAT family N-acetyltransferase n=1 Tax=Legionella pneumophila TaxID=446 RepID=UPI0004920679|nr:GNAT family N-acetyltransferase [Legionella pneumophila]RYB40222.1 GNAT family N-acetyltransferase [Legionella pneumophila]RYW28543.1 GNAT family N-acetyltransferase [Legionella pneumophila]HAT1867341.1 GNAT family N-acetyltransferase [Legionella pneumophila]HAT1907468.1 GNAT family N-acetyltransferase [Legionella pneumophila]HAT1916847.1 GNAT family N-acetyltransferase [Legionella pneumophila]